MTAFICVTCGTQHAPGAEPPTRCAICEDDRQYVGWNGQQWTTLEDLRTGHECEIRDDLGLTGIGIKPSFAIGQRALLVRTPGGNVLWDCIPLVDEATVRAVRELGGVRAIAISHPHYYSSMVDWARAFGATVLLHESDREWVMRPDESIRYWGGASRELWDGMALVRAGGHFPGGTVLHWPAGAGGRGALLTGDIVMVAGDRRWVSFMYSFPNYVPLSAAAVERVVASIETFDFDRIYGAWWDRNVESGARDAVRRSADRYRRALSS